MPTFLTLPIALLSSSSDTKSQRITHRLGLDQMELVGVGTRSGVDYVSVVVDEVGHRSGIAHPDLVVGAIGHRSGLSSIDVTAISHRFGLTSLGYQDLLHQFGVAHQEVEVAPIRSWSGLLTTEVQSDFIDSHLGVLHELELTEVPHSSGLKHTAVEEEVIETQFIGHSSGLSTTDVELDTVDHRVGLSHSQIFADAAIFFDADMFTDTWVNSGSLGGRAYAPAASQSPVASIASDLNNRRVLVFDGVDDYLITDPLYCKLAALYILFKWNSTPTASDGILTTRTTAGKAAASNENILVQASGTTSTRNIYGNSTATGCVLNGTARTTTTYNTTPGIAPATGWNLLVHQKANSVLGDKCFAIGADTSSTVITARTAPISIACVIGFESHSPEQLQQVQTVIKQYYGAFF